MEQGCTSTEGVPPLVGNPHLLSSHTVHYNPVQVPCGGSSFGIAGSNPAVSDTGNDGSVNAGNGQVVITYIVSAATTPTTTTTTTTPGPGTAASTGGTTGTKPPVLAVTGLDVLPLLVAAIALIAGGVALVEVTSRRQKRTAKAPWRLH
jgi:hypothetical protein